MTKDQIDGIARCTINGVEGVALRYTQGANARLCEALSITDLEGMIEIAQGINAETLPKFVWAGRLHELPDLTMEEVLTWTVPYFLALPAVIEAVNLSLFGAPDLESVGDQGADDDAVDPPQAKSGA